MLNANEVLVVLSGEFSMLLEVVPSKLFDKLQGREWGYISVPDDRLPKWVHSIPADEQLQLLASGPKFASEGREDECIIGSEMLFGDGAALPTDSRPLRELNDDWYVAIADRNFENVLVAEASQLSSEKWVRRLQDVTNESQLYLVPKHEDQKE